MKEHLLHYIWQNKLFNTKELKTTEGSELQILSFGKYNKDGGPDFLNAKIKIEDIILVGHIELHIQSSDWKLHKHQLDKKYENVILHVVYNHNDIINKHLPTLELNGRISMILLDKYQQMSDSEEEYICKKFLNNVDVFTIENWKERMVVERLERKSIELLRLLQEYNSDWEKVCYQLLGKYFGSHINNEAFQMLTTYLDYKILLNHKENLFQLEALLFGVAGFLNKDFVEIYPRELKREYLYLKHKYQLKQMNEHQWQFLRIRPISFPTVRIAWFAQLVQYLPMMQQIIENKNSAQIIDKLNVSSYWESHFVFDKLSISKPKHSGKVFKDTLGINVFVPLIYAYGKYINGENYLQQALDILYAIPPEINNKTKLYEKNIFNQQNAFHSQSVIEMYDSYCLQKKCLECAIGNKILSSNIIGNKDKVQYTR